MADSNYNIYVEVGPLPGCGNRAWHYPRGVMLGAARFVCRSDGSRLIDFYGKDQMGFYSFGPLSLVRVLFPDGSVRPYRGSRIRFLTDIEALAAGWEDKDNG